MTKIRYNIDKKAPKEKAADRIITIPLSLAPRFENRGYILRNTELYSTVDIMKFTIKRTQDCFYFVRDGERLSGIPRKPEEWEF